MGFRQLGPRYQYFAWKKNLLRNGDNLQIILDSRLTSFVQYFTQVWQNGAHLRATTAIYHFIIYHGKLRTSIEYYLSSSLWKLCHLWETSTWMGLPFPKINTNISFIHINNCNPSDKMTKTLFMNCVCLWFTYSETEHLKGFHHFLSVLRKTF